eukprot:6037591-Prymnesium_polylepis.1
MGARNGSSFPAAARCGFRAIALLGATSRARTGVGLGFESRRFSLYHTSPLSTLWDHHGGGSRILRGGSLSQFKGRLG